MQNLSYSKEGQDLFVLNQLKNKRNGCFVEVGTAMPIEHNNTFLLESSYGWSGLLIEIDDRYINSIISQRKSTLIHGNALEIDYLKKFKDLNFPKVIDYLSLDIDPPNNTLEVLKILPLQEYSFSCVTFEHDRYWFGDSVANESREIFKKYGYTMIKKDVLCPAGPFEDWYIKE